MYQIIFIYAFIYRNYLTVVLIQHNIKSDIRTRFKDLDVSILVEHTAQHPNSCPVVQALALYGLGRIDSGGTLVERDAPNPNHRGSDKISMVEAGRVELPSKNQSRTASPSADIYLHSLKLMPNVRPQLLVAPYS